MEADSNDQTKDPRVPLIIHRDGTCKAAPDDLEAAGINHPPIQARKI